MASLTQTVTIPGSLFDTYRQYKTSTTTVLQWLSENEANTAQSTFTVEMLRRAAENARARNIPVPEVVYRAFQDNVAKRREVSNWFESAEYNEGGEISGSTLNHIYYAEQKVWHSRH